MNYKMGDLEDLANTQTSPAHTRQALEIIALCNGAKSTQQQRLGTDIVLLHEPFVSVCVPSITSAAILPIPLTTNQNTEP